jgi:hypothetical protein
MQKPKHLPKLNASGVYMSGPGMGGELSGTVEVLFAGLIGGVAGLVFGLLFGSFARIFTLNRVKGVVGGIHWGAYGAGAGALALAMIELFD